MTWCAVADSFGPTPSEYVAHTCLPSAPGCHDASAGNAVHRPAAPAEKKPATSPPNAGIAAVPRQNAIRAIHEEAV